MIINSNNIILRAAAVLVIVLLLGLLSSCGGGTSSDFALPTRSLLDASEILNFGSYTYSVYDDGTVVLYTYSGSETNITIPTVIEGKKVIEIAPGIFSENTSLRSVTISGDIEIIGDFAFYACDSLSSVSIGKKVWSIGIAAFEGTPWLRGQTDEFVVVGDGVLIGYLGDSKEIKVPDYVRHISGAFESNQDIINVEIGESVLTIGTYAFASCVGLRRVDFGLNLRYIGDYAFENCEVLTTVDIPDSVEKIGSFAFTSCYRLTTARVGNSVSSIGDYAFYRCSRLSSITLPVSLVEIGDFVFNDCYSFGVLFYAGTEEDLAALGLGESNYILKDAMIIYGVGGGDDEISS